MAPEVSIERPDRAPHGLSVEESARYARHLQSPDIGLDGQLRLRGARVLLVGVGGLGSASGLYLAAAGVGTLGIVDDDVVELSNLQRQVLHTTECVGMAKVDSAARAIRAVNPDVHVVEQRTRLQARNVMDIAEGYDLIVDGVDSVAARYVLNDAAVRLRVPLVSAAVCGWEGRVSVFQPPLGPCYRCVCRVDLPSEPPDDCLGPVPGIIGSLQAVEALKLLTGAGDPLIGRMLVYDALAGTFAELRIERDLECPACGAARGSSANHSSTFGTVTVPAGSMVRSP